MNQTFLQSVGAVLTNGLKATVELQGVGEGRIKLVYTPDIGATPDNATQSLMKLRAAIAKPLVVTGSPLEIEEAFALLVGEKSAVVKRGLSALDDIERIAEAAVAEANATRPKAPSTQDTNVEEEVEEEIVENPGTSPTAAPVQPNVTSGATTGLKASEF
ncbi:PRTRC system protein E [Pseudomonas rhodesiae]|uniref:PRTRC system protein E n=1 Tax=Pseudomonas rhodesiae TaxID=76760 RepID=UPI0020A19E70|nr:PRTRC system protein E [Pseudomonas rhodesiae]MCP1515681.1 PRTRC genetic system protein E [Pseudomonas rhodesiae]MDF9772930.1 PRTRC genetic system protein E [Pseudomonas rhodesiae]